MKRRSAAGGALKQRSALWIPLSCYLGITVAVPMLNGGYARATFWQHALVVATTTLVMWAALHTIRSLRDAANAKREVRSAKARSHPRITHSRKRQGAGDLIYR